MAQTEGGVNRATRPLFTIPASNLQGDLLRRVVSGNDLSQKVVVDEEVTDDVELSLGLSLNGRFGVDPARAKAGMHLKRWSSVSDFSPAAVAVLREEEATTTCRAPRPCMVPLMRTCSMPSETEEDWRKRKELQSLRRMEAKRKRSEKQQRSMHSKLQRDHRIRENFEEDISRLGYNQANNGGGCPPLPPLPPPDQSQGTIGSQGSGSSGVTESDGQAAQVVHSCAEARGDSNTESLPKSENEPRAKPPQMAMTAQNSGQFNGVVRVQNHCNQSTSAHNGTKETVSNVLENMPSVSTKGDGPQGKRIEGFLYRYKKGEEVRIVCVCHGDFLTPAEFVKHAGGGDVPHPLKHIVVNPTPIL